MLLSSLHPSSSRITGTSNGWASMKWSSTSFDIHPKHATTPKLLWNVFQQSFTTQVYDCPIQRNRVRIKETVNYLLDLAVVCSFFVPWHSIQIFRQPLQKARALPLPHTSIHFATHGLIAAHPRSPAVANMNMNTTASSFLESLSTMTH